MGLLPQLQRQQHKITSSILKRDSQTSFKHFNLIWTEKAFHPTQVPGSCLRRVKVVAIVLTTGFDLLLHFQRPLKSLWQLRCGSYSYRLRFALSWGFLASLDQNSSQGKTLKRSFYQERSTAPTRSFSAVLPGFIHPHTLIQPHYSKRYSMKARGRPHPGSASHPIFAQVPEHLRTSLSLPIK